jgi:hypothetical protein
MKPADKDNILDNIVITLSLFVFPLFGVLVCVCWFLYFAYIIDNKD